MSLLREEYATEIFTLIDTHGIAIHHAVLHADRPTLLERIRHDTTLSEQATAFRLSKLDSYRHAYSTWLANAGHVIDTARLTPGEVADRIAASIRIS